MMTMNGWPGVSGVMAALHMAAYKMSHYMARITAEEIRSRRRVSYAHRANATLRLIRECHNAHSTPDALKHLRRRHHLLRAALMVKELAKLEKPRLYGQDVPPRIRTRIRRIRRAMKAALRHAGLAEWARVHHAPLPF